MGTVLAALQDRTKYRPTADSALMRWIVRHAAWLIPRFRGSYVQSPFYRAMGEPYRGKLVEFGETVGKSRNEVGRRMEIWRVAGKVGPHGRAPCPNRR